MKSSRLVSAALGLSSAAFCQRVSYAQRPDDQSICDYYAEQRYGKSNSTTQFLLMSNIVTLAYAGGDDLTSQTKDDTGIFNTGTYDDKDVYLRPWFDGTKATTNLNNQAIGVNWLDGGGVEPLRSFLNGSSKNLDLDKDSNQYRLFTHWFTAFGNIYGCTETGSFPKAQSSSGSDKRLPPAYVHKYMDLNQTQVAYFIEQLTAASKHFGFSDADAQTLDVTMNARYNIRCAPADQDGYLNSICLNEDCPLAQPTADCGAYKDISANALNSSGGARPSSSAPASSSSAASTSAAAATSDAASGGKSDSGLSGGEIAGVVIGCVAVALVAVGMFLFFRRRRNNNNNHHLNGGSSQSQMAHSTVGSLPSGMLIHTAPTSEQSQSPHPMSTRGLNLNSGSYHGGGEGYPHAGYEGAGGQWSRHQSPPPAPPAEAPGDSVHGESIRGTMMSMESPTYTNAWRGSQGQGQSQTPEMEDRQSPPLNGQYSTHNYGSYMGG